MPGRQGSPVVDAHAAEGPVRRALRDGPARAAVELGGDLAGGGAQVRLHDLLHAPAPALVHERLPPARPAVTAGLLLLAPLAEHPRDRGAREAQRLGRAGHAAARAPRAHDRPALEVTQITLLPHPGS